ncbi:MAG: hypothetical protein ACPGLV_12960 [Bacteroidia bacterium]
MWNFFKKVILVLWISFTSLQLYSQKILTEKQKNGEYNSAQSKHSVNLELGGRSFIISTLAYEYKFTQHFSAGAGLGFNSFSSGNIIRNNNGQRETGNYLSLYSTHKAFGTYFIGRERHKLFITGGFTYFRKYERIVYPSETIKERVQVLKRNLGLGYQFSGRKMYYRLTAYYLELPNISRYFYANIPWLGLTLGYGF